MHDRLPLIRISGTLQRCGLKYGELMSPMIRGFYSLLVSKMERRLPYAKKCWKRISLDAPHSASFIEGMAQGSKIGIEKIVLLLLNEELNHHPHCSALVCNSKGRKTYVGQTWDWPTSTFAWPGFLLMKSRLGIPTLTYHYPGLWSACGVNENGLALMWTGSGFFPKIKPRVGLPTYVLIWETLQRKNVDEATQYLQNVRNAGSFIFLLGDASGKHAAVEAAPGKLVSCMHRDVICRSNYFLIPEVVQRSKQWRTDVLNEKTSMVERLHVLEDLIKNNRQHLGLPAIKSILTTSPDIHDMEMNDMTVDSIIAVCQERTLWTIRGGFNPCNWFSYSL